MIDESPIMWCESVFGCLIEVMQAEGYDGVNVPAGNGTWRWLTLEEVQSVYRFACAHPDFFDAP